MDFNLFLVLLVFSFVSTLVSYFTKSRLFTVMAGMGFLLCGLFWWGGLEQAVGIQKNYVYGVVNDTSWLCVNGVLNYATMNCTAMDVHGSGDFWPQVTYTNHTVVYSVNETTLYQSFNSNSTVTGGGGGVLANPNQFNWAFGLMLTLLGAGILFASAASWRGSKG